MMVIHTDGACFGNPGPMGIGVAVYKSGKLTHTISEYIGKGTNNVAEYIAVLRALEYAKSVSEHEVELRSDSELLIKQMNSEYKVKMPHLKELKQKIDSVMKEMKVKFKWVSREENAVADELSKSAIKTQL